MIPIRFSTERLRVSGWAPDIAKQHLRRALETELAKVLTPAVLAPLPPSMQLDAGVAAWVDARRAESDVLLVRRKNGNALIGMMILSRDPDADEELTIHVGYLLAQTVWGYGYASELLGGFIAFCRSTPVRRLEAGVDLGNPASARVLQKSGFALCPDRSSDGVDIYVRDVS